MSAVWFDDLACTLRDSLAQARMLMAAADDAAAAKDLPGFIEAVTSAQQSIIDAHRQSVALADHLLEAMRLARRAGLTKWPEN